MGYRWVPYHQLWGWQPPMLAAANAPDSRPLPSVGTNKYAQPCSPMVDAQARHDLVVIAATNRPDCIDSALLRPGRFDRLIYVPPPDAAAREAIFKIHTSRMPLEQDVNLTNLAAQAQGYTGAEVAAVCREAGLAALDSNIHADCVTLQHFFTALAAVAPASSPTQAAADMYASFSRQAGPA